MSDIDGERKIEYVLMEVIGNGAGLCCIQWKGDEFVDMMPCQTQSRPWAMKEIAEVSETVTRSRRGRDDKVVANDEVGRRTLCQAHAHDLDGRCLQ